MNIIKYIPIFFSIILAVIVSCSPDKQAENGSYNKESIQLSNEKQKISSFWESYRQAQKYRVKGQWQEAAKYYLKALEIDKDHEDAQFNLGNMYLELKQYKKAEQRWLDIVEVNHNSARSYMQLGRLYLSYERVETFDIEKAREAFLKARELNKVITGPAMLLGHVALLKGEDNVAKDYFRSVIGSDTKNVEAYFLLGYLYWKTGNIDKSEQMFEVAIKNSIPEKVIDGDLSEGDTKGGISHLRPLNESLFYDYFHDIYKMEIRDISISMNERYNKLDLKLNELKF